MYYLLLIQSVIYNYFYIDCCDGSDEWANHLLNGVCRNTCKELGRTARIELHKVDNLYSIGFEIRSKIITQGKYILSQKRVSYFNYCFYFINSNLGTVYSL